MRLTSTTLSAAAVVLLHAGTVSADYLSILTWRWGSSWNSGWGLWTTAGGTYHFDANAYCRNPGVPSVNEVCMDWDASPPRGHFHATGQAKRCFRQSHKHDVGCYGPSSLGHECYLHRWNEVECTW